MWQLRAAGFEEVVRRGRLSHEVVSMKLIHEAGAANTHKAKIRAILALWTTATPDVSRKSTCFSAAGYIFFCKIVQRRKFNAESDQIRDRGCIGLGI